MSAARTFLLGVVLGALVAVGAIYGLVRTPGAVTASCTMTVGGVEIPCEQAIRFEMQQAGKWTGGRG